MEDVPSIESKGCEGEDLEDSVDTDVLPILGPLVADVGVSPPLEPDFCLMLATRHEISSADVSDSPGNLSITIQMTRMPKKMPMLTAPTCWK